MRQHLTDFLDVFAAAQAVVETHVGTCVTLAVRCAPRSRARLSVAERFVAAARSMRALRHSPIMVRTWTHGDENGPAGLTRVIHMFPSSLASGDGAA